MIKAILFDLDSCLAAANEVGEDLYTPAFEAIRRASNGEVPEEKLQAAFSDCWRHPLDWVAAKFGFSEAMLVAGWQVFRKMEAKRPMHGYGDLHVLRGWPTLLFLVTAGFRVLQESKINALGIGPLFADVRIDAIDEPNRKGKKRLFQEILEEHRFDPSEVLVVGDNPDSEIEAGNQLGIRTVQILRAGVPRGNNATFHTHSLVELKQLVMDLRIKEV